jgi:rhodanese-related sulfurtransferase
MVSNRLWYQFIVLPLLLLLALTAANPSIGQEPIISEAKLRIILDMYRSYRKDFPAAVDISAEEAMRLSEQGAVIFIDARKPEEQAVSMIQGAITEAAFITAPVVPEGKKAVAYCTIGYRSGVLSEKMDKQGIPVVNLAGGILAWVLEGGKVYHEGKEAKRVHVYGEKCNYLPEGYEPVMFGFFEQVTK